jgi:hypothetical protein
VSASIRYSAQGWGVCGIVGDGETIRFSATGLWGPGSPVLESRPSPDRWEAFWSLVEALGAWGWGGDYGQVLCGTPWRLELERGGKVMSCSGNGYLVPFAPPGFKELYRALEGLAEEPARRKGRDRHKRRGT